MSIEVHCANCSQHVRVKSKYAGKRVHCPHCEHLIQVPQVEGGLDSSSEILGAVTAPPPLPPPTAPPQVERRPPAMIPHVAPIVRKPPKSGLPVWVVTTACSAAIVLFMLAVYVAYTLGTRTGPSSVAQANPAKTEETPSNQSSRPRPTPPLPPSPPMTDGRNAKGTASVASTSPPAKPTAPASSAETSPTSPAPTSPAPTSPAPANPADGTTKATSEAQPPANDSGKSAPADPADSKEIPAVHASDPAAASAPRPKADVIDFQALPLESPATSMAMTEDGRYLVVSHQTANQLTIYDVLSRKVAATVATTAPRCVLCRGDKIFVSNYGQGTISVFAHRDEWQQVNELKVLKPNVVHLSAPGGKNFADTLLITCHGDGPEASYQNSQVFVLDMATDKCRPVSQAAVASASYDGRLILTQGSFCLSPSGDLAAFNFKDYVSAGDKAQPITRGGNTQTPYVYQVAAGSYWIGNDIVFGGVPLAASKQDLGKLIVPDLSQNVLYALTAFSVTAHRLDVTFTEVGNRAAKFPMTEDDFHEVYHHLYRIRDYLLDHPVAYTHGDRLSLFVLTATGGLVLAAETQAFAPNSATALGPDAGASVGSKEPADIESKSSVASPEAGPAEGLLVGFPSRIAAGKPFQFRLTIPEHATLELMSPVTGLTLTPAGELNWTPTSEQVGVHELKIRLQHGKGITFLRPQLEVIDAELAASVGGDLSKLGDYPRLELDVDRYALAEGLGHKRMLLLQGDSLRELADDGISVTNTLVLPNRYDFIEERRDTYIAVASTPAPVLHVIDKSTMTVFREIPLRTSEVQVSEITDLAISPASGQSFVAVKFAAELPRYTVLKVDEETGRVQAPGILGTWVEVSPDGKRLITGYRDLYERGSSFHINPDWNLIEIPEYGNVDMLMSWSTGALPRLRQVVRQAGGNGSGIRVSPDGKRVTYLSFAGTPVHSKNLQGWNTTDLDAPAVTYQTKDQAVTSELAFHPTLPIVAVPGGVAAVLFDRETGEVIPNKLMIPLDGLGSVQVERLYFSPNGRNLVFLCSEDAMGRFLQAVPLKLTEKDLANGVPLPPPAHASRERDTQYHLFRDFQGLHADHSSYTLKPNEIAKKYLDSVVSITTEDGSGSGFLIDSRGFLLTSAHVVRDVESLKVIYNSRPRMDDYGPEEISAILVRLDEDLDLALLKIDAPIPLGYACLAANDQVEMGEAVTVIGSPGLGEMILDQTLTTGVVSNPNREIDEQSFIQISAAVNPGNSGGPVFDEHGTVIGLVSLKGRLEGTGFAVPVAAIRTFLQPPRDGK